MRSIPIKYINEGYTYIYARYEELAAAMHPGALYTEGNDDSDDNNTACLHLQHFAIWPKSTMSL